MKHIFTFLIIFLFLSCNNDKKKNLNYPEPKQVQKQIVQPKVVQPKTTLTNKIEYKPIFLNLSPKMDLSEFNYKLRNNPNLKNGKFILSLNDEECKFDILKKENKIMLSSEFDNLKYINNRDKTEENSLYKNEKIIVELIEIFKNKYGNYVSILPFKKNIKGVYINEFLDPFDEEILFSRMFQRVLEETDVRKTLFDYGFRKDKYFVFQDSIKTILVGYTNRIPAKKFISFEDAQLQNEQNIGNSFSGKFSDEEYFKYINQPNKIPKFEVSIDYYYNSDFEIILKKINNDKYEFEQAKYKRDSIEKAKKMKMTINRSKL